MRWMRRKLRTTATPMARRAIANRRAK